jgi:predicted GIY-YIG superfamily endonuclease
MSTADQESKRPSIARKSIGTKKPPHTTITTTSNTIAATASAPAALGTAVKGKASSSSSAPRKITLPTSRKREKKVEVPHENVVYLLQMKKPGSATVFTYIGSTNNFRRRLRQHNGDLAGGAKSTARRSEHHEYPWTPICLVRGFPLRRHALGFEKRVKHILLSTRTRTTPKLGPRLLAHNAKKRESDISKPIHPRVRRFLIMCCLDQWTKKCPPARLHPLQFEWHAPEHRPVRPLTSSEAYLPPYVVEIDVPPPIPIATTVVAAATTRSES